MFSEVLPAQWLTEKLCIFIPYCCQNWRHQCQELFLHLVGNAMLINTNVYSDLHMSSQKGSFVIAFLGTSSPTLFSLNWSLLFFLGIRSVKISLFFLRIRSVKISLLFFLGIRSVKISCRSLWNQFWTAQKKLKTLIMCGQK